MTDIEALSDAQLAKVFLVTKPVTEDPRTASLELMLPSLAIRLKKRGVTKKMLFEQYHSQHPDGFKETAFRQRLSGVAAYKGCPAPDTDGDGIKDDLDSCINTPGISRYSGCPVPDRDGDKVNDELDQCPDVFGMAVNKGCPVNKDSIARKIDDAAQNIFFITGSYEIDSSSFKALDEVIKLLRENPVFNLDIEGHTDNEGSESSNQLLSEQRAKAVYDYLNKKGIPRFRLQSFGYGQTHPVANNRTKEGRALNRRVEMKLK